MNKSPDEHKPSEDLNKTKSSDEPKEDPTQVPAQFKSWLFFLEKLQRSRGLSPIRIADALESRTTGFFIAVICGVIAPFCAYPVLKEAFPKAQEYLIGVYSFSSVPAGVCAGYLIARMLQRAKDWFNNIGDERRFRSIQRAIESTNKVLSQMPADASPETRKSFEDTLQNLLDSQQAIVRRIRERNGF